MALNLTREQGLRWAVQGMLVVVVLVAAFAATQYMKVDELESSLAQTKAEAQKANQDAAAARKKIQDELKAATAKATALEEKQRETDNIKALLAKVEPQVAAMLETAAKTGKPEAKSAALTGVGLIGQVAHGANHDASLGVLVRALAMDKGNCVAALAINQIGKQTVEVPANCEGLLPGAAPAAAAKAATEAKPAADAKAAATPAPAPATASGGAKAAPPSGK